MATIERHPRTVLRCVYQCLSHHLTPSGEGISIKTFQIRLTKATVLMCLGDFGGGVGNILKMEDGGLKLPIPEPIEEDLQEIQGGNGQGKSGSHPLDEFLKGFEGALF